MNKRTQANPHPLPPFSRFLPLLAGPSPLLPNSNQNDTHNATPQRLDPALSEAGLAEKVTAVRGIGPWSAQMFLMFHLHRPDLLPLGDLGVRNGIARHFGAKGHGKNGGLDEKKDKDQMEALFSPFAPYRSVATWYMWRALETKPYDEAME